MGLEEDLLLEEEEEGNEEQFVRVQAAYQAERAGPTAIFEYAWVLTRSEKDEDVREGIRTLKALQYEVKSTRGHALLTIAKAYRRLGELSNARKHAHILIQSYPRTDPERNENLRKGIQLHKELRSEIERTGWNFVGSVWVVGILVGIGYVVMASKNRP